MHAFSSIMLIATIFSTAHAADFLIENLQFHGDENVQIGNTNCGQDCYSYKDITCDDNVVLVLGDLIPKDCTPPTCSRSWTGIIASGNCVNVNGDIFLDE